MKRVVVDGIEIYEENILIMEMRHRKLIMKKNEQKTNTVKSKGMCFSISYKLNGD